MRTLTSGSGGVGLAVGGSRRARSTSAGGPRGVLVGADDQLPQPLQLLLHGGQTLRQVIGIHARLQPYRPPPVRPAVYIPNFNGARRLGAALASLREQSRPLDVVVVDNGSSDDSVELVRERFPEVDLLELGANLGFGPALNRAVAAHPADPVILLNNDAVPRRASSRRCSTPTRPVPRRSPGSSSRSGRRT